MLTTLTALVAAAVLEIAGDALIRHGLARWAWPWLLVGSACLAAYGFVVNASRTIEFGRLMGAYIAIFFLVSQVIAGAAFGERPSVTLLVGGTLIVVGGALIQLGIP